jgi:hypothetical protein
MAAIDSKRLTELARPAGKQLQRLHAATRPHQLYPGDRFQSAYQHCASVTLFPSYRIHAPVNAINEIDVRSAGWSVEGAVAPRHSGGSVARGILRPQIRLCFHDATCGNALGRTTLEHRAEEIARDVLRLAVIELRR